VIQTSEVEVRVRTDPFRIAFYDRAGRLISDDAQPADKDSQPVMNWDTAFWGTAPLSMPKVS
jgi:hypothetical protein